MVDRMITGEQLLVIVNSLPLYFVIQMFFDAEAIGLTQMGNNVTTATNTPYNDSVVHEGSISYRVWQVLKNELERIRLTQLQMQQPMLILQRIKNLIHTSTTLLSYFLCFQTPLEDKSSSSQLHSANS